MKECKRRCDKKLSAGFFGVLLASHLCGKVVAHLCTRVHTSPALHLQEAHTGVFFCTRWMCMGSPKPRATWGITSIRR